jgi:hypothetical protein
MNFTIGVGLGNSLGVCVKYLAIFFTAVLDFMIFGDNNIQVCAVSGRDDF